MFVTSIPGAGKLIGVYGGHDPYVDIGQFIPNSGKSTYYLRVQPSSKNDFSFVINGIGEGSKPSYGLELRKKF